MERVISVATTPQPGVLEFTNSILSPGAEPVEHTVHVDESRFVSGLGPGRGMLLPPGTRWMSVDGRSLIVEQTPSMHRIRYRQTQKDDLRTRGADYTLPFPYIVYGISPSPDLIPYVSHIYIRKSPIKHLMDELYPIGIPNVFTDGAICTHHLPEKEDLPYHVMVNKAIMEFWNSNFNNDVADFIRTSTYISLLNAANGSGTKYQSVYDYWQDLATAADFNYVVKWQRVAHVYFLIEHLLQNNTTFNFGHRLESRVLSDLVVNGMKSSVPT